MKLKTLSLFLVLIVTVALAQRGRGPGPVFRYDASSETTLKGTIEEVKTLDMMCHSGTHVTLNTDKGNLEVALGPSEFLADQKIDLKKGEQIQIVGAKANTRRGEMFVARQITVAGQTTNLRDEKGLPSWPRGMCR